MKFEELRAFLHETNHGQVFDSLVAVEIGLDEYQCAWDAHCDMNPHAETDDVIAAFLIDVGEFIGVGDTDFDKVLANIE